MLKVALLSAFAVLSPSLSLAAEESKPESERSALDLLQKARKAVGPLRRFEIQCHRRVLDEARVTDERSRVRLYYDQSAGFLLECRPVDCAQIQASQRTQDGQLYRIRTLEPETWLATTSVVTVLDEDRRTYRSVQVPPHESCFSSWLFSPLQVIPPWFDPTVDCSQLKSRLRIESAESTPSEFRIKLVPLRRNRAWRLLDDERLTSRQTVVIDRQTLLPKTWSIAQRTCDVTFVYTRFDPHPPQRELKVDLTGCRNDSPIIQPAAATEPSSARSEATLEVGARILLWLLF